VSSIREKYDLVIDDVAIGVGAHSEVYKSVDQKSGNEYAVKVINLNEHSDFIFQEIRIMRLLNDRHFIQLKDALMVDANQVVVFQELG
jgi:serine/threonine protein kinase